MNKKNELVFKISPIHYQMREKKEHKKIKIIFQTLSIKFQNEMIYQTQIRALHCNTWMKKNPFFYFLQIMLKKGEQPIVECRRATEEQSIRQYGDFDLGFSEPCDDTVDLAILTNHSYVAYFSGEPANLVQPLQSVTPRLVYTRLAFLQDPETEKVFDLANYPLGRKRSHEEAFSLTLSTPVPSLLPPCFNFLENKFVSITEDLPSNDLKLKEGGDKTISDVAESSSYAKTNAAFSLGPSFPLLEEEDLRASNEFIPFSIIADIVD